MCGAAASTCASLCVWCSAEPLPCDALRTAAGRVPVSSLLPRGHQQLCTEDHTAAARRCTTPALLAHHLSGAPCSRGGRPSSSTTYSAGFSPTHLTVQAL